MCAYGALNGVPSCASDFLLKDQLREAWKSDALVQTDCCDSLYTIESPFHYAPTREAALVAAVNAGVQLYYGYGPKETKEHWNTSLGNGTLSHEQLDASAARILLTRFRAGEFDEDHPFRALDVEGAVDTPEHRQLARAAAASSVVLLRNDGHLPLRLSDGQRIVVSGPFSDCRSINPKPGYGEANCYAHSYSGAPSHVVTVLQALEATAPSGASVMFAQGANETATSDAMLAEAADAARDADVVVLSLGSGAKIEAESKGRTTLQLPDAQTRLLAAIRGAVSANATVVIMLFTAGGIPLESRSNEALLHVFYPGEEAGSGIVDVLTGAVNPSARLPLTVYPEEYLEHVSPIVDFDVSTGVGRTYRYLDETLIKPTYRFGFGLSYTTFDYSDLVLHADDAGVDVQVTVANTGARAGHEVVQVYVSLPEQPNGEIVPVSSLCAFTKVFLEAGEHLPVSFRIEGYALQVVGADGSRTPAIGNATVHVGGYSPGAVSATSGQVSAEVLLTQAIALV